MNAQLIPIDPHSVVERAANALSKAETEIEIKALVEQSKPIVAVTDKASREVCHESLMTLKKMRVLIEKRGKEGREEAVKYSKAVIAIEDELVALISPEETRLAALRDEWDAAKEREKEAAIQAEIKRVSDIQQRIAEMRELAKFGAVAGPAFIEPRLAKVEAIVIDETFAEFSGQALEAKTAAVAGIKEMLAAAVQRVAEREELEKLKAANAQRDAEQAERDAQAKAALDSERAENARIAEEQRQTNAAEAGRIAATREALERELAALRKAQEPKPETTPEPIKVSVRTIERPSAAQLVALVAEHYRVSTEMATRWLLTAKIELEQVAA